MDIFGIFSAMMDVQRSWVERPLELARMQADLLVKLQEATTEETASASAARGSGSRRKAPVRRISSTC